MTEKATKLVTVKYFDHLVSLVLGSYANRIPIKCEKRENMWKSVL